MPIMGRARMALLLQVFFLVFLNCRILAAPLEEESKTCTDEGTCGKQNDHEGGDYEHVSSPWAFMKAFSKLGTSWNHVIGEYISVVKGADGFELKDDVYALGMEEALGSLRLMVDEAVSRESAAFSTPPNEHELAWAFTTTPLADFGKTKNDVLSAFLRWSVVDSNTDLGDAACQLIGGINTYPLSAETVPEEMAVSKINVSKAFRRLTSYVHWMQSVASDLMDPPLTMDSISPSLSTFSIHASHDSCGRLIWWVNLGKTDMSAFKSQSPRETTRMFVWVAHMLFLDEGAQTKGLVVVDDMAAIGFWEYMTMLPIQVGISVDRFLISVTPLKAKNVVLMHLPKWAEIGYGLLSWFLTAKMKSRVTLVAGGKELETLTRIAGGPEFIPQDFGPFGGALTTDMIGEMLDL